MEAYNRGKEDFALGVMMSGCPYGFHSLWDRYEWNQGWLDAQREWLKDKMFNNG